jgi:hypothetical protein
MHDVQLGIYLRRHEYGQLLDVVHQMLDLLNDAPLFDAGGLSGYSNLAEACLVLWEAQPHAADLRRLSDKACKHLGRYARALPIGRPRSGVWLGQHNWLSGRRAKAQRLWQRSLAQAGQLGMAYDEGLAHYAIGRGLEAGHPDRARYLEGARDIFSRLGAASALADVESELEGHRA